jgi:hypothetical protein
MRQPIRSMATVLPLFGMVAALSMAQTTEPRAETIAAFDRYVRQAEQKMEDDLRAGGPFLLPDQWSRERRDSAYQQLQHGEMIVERLDRNRAEARVQHGLIHHWAGIVLIPRATLDQALTLIQDYDHHQEIYSPEVVRSRLIGRQGDDFQIFLRLKKHRVLTVVLDTEYDVQFVRLDSHRAYSRSHSTRITEVENPGQRDERLLRAGEDHGFLWALDAYWRFLQTEDGVYVQCEAISLTHDIPAGLGWLIGPLIHSLPRESLGFTLVATRKAVAARQAAIAVRIAR